MWGGGSGAGAPGKGWSTGGNSPRLGRRAVVAIGGEVPMSRDGVEDGPRPSGQRLSCFAAAGPGPRGPWPPSPGWVSRAGNGSRTVKGDW